MIGEEGRERKTAELRKARLRMGEKLQPMYMG